MVVETPIRRAKGLGYRKPCVRRVYTYNIGSQKIFESMGFVRFGKRRVFPRFCVWELILEQIMPIDSAGVFRVTIEKVDTDYFITVDHPMTKEHYQAFAAYVKSGGVYLHLLYPEQSPRFRFPMIADGRLFVYSTEIGLIEYPHRLT